MSFYVERMFNNTPNLLIDRLLGGLPDEMRALLDRGGAEPMESQQDESDGLDRRAR